MNRFYGGRLSSTPPVTKNLIIINVVMLLLAMLFQRMFNVNLNGVLGMFFFQSPLFKPWQIVTHMFMHGGLGHIFFNMYALWIFGKTLESVWGSKRFLIYYLATGLGAAFFHQLVNYIQFAPEIAALKGAYSVDRINYALLNEILQPGNQFYQFGRELMRPTVGASGAVYGVLLAFGMLFPNTPLYIMFIPIPIKAKWLVIGFGALELFLGITQSGGSIAHFAHLGGMIFGFFLIRYWNKFTQNFY
ncbi:MAG: rhomboid family intramembrane serine protease [Bacteroidetes bacterium]|nr:MAG: rhomboid family intramembrane serine protease [Bacteroidota bacterium]RLD92420.1 MAG: rhomboid family intramembrane serine protease [Bacteroidota bacterium]RLE05678.1 MAG: rhomboid family intramembrane serine protease [Bacteroidota bacterium]